MQTAGTMALEKSRVSETIALGAVIRPLLGTLLWIFTGVARPGYSSVSQPISALAIGAGGILMRLGFLLDGLLTFAGTVVIFRALRREIGPVARWLSSILLAISPLGLFWDGIFTMDTLQLHLIGVQLFVATTIVTFPVVGLIVRRSPAWKRFGTWLILGGPLTLALLFGFATSVPANQMVTGGGSYGLWERALVTEVQFWFVLMGWLAYRRSTK